MHHRPCRAFQSVLRVSFAGWLFEAVCPAFHLQRDPLKAVLWSLAAIPAQRLKTAHRAATGVPWVYSASYGPFVSFDTKG
jgi:GH18 family chitinase